MLSGQEREKQSTIQQDSESEDGNMEQDENSMKNRAAVIGDFHSTIETCDRKK